MEVESAEMSNERAADVVLAAGCLDDVDDLLALLVDIPLWDGVLVGVRDLRDGFGVLDERPAVNAAAAFCCCSRRRSRSCRSRD